MSKVAWLVDHLDRNTYEIFRLGSENIPYTFSLFDDMLHCEEMTKKNIKLQGNIRKSTFYSSICTCLIEVEHLLFSTVILLKNH